MLAPNEVKAAAKKKEESKNKNRKSNRYKDSFANCEEQNDTFAFTAGYTSWGFPYGITWDELEPEAGKGKTLEFKMIDEDEAVPF